MALAQLATEAPGSLKDLRSAGWISSCLALAGVEGRHRVCADQLFRDNTQANRSWSTCRALPRPWEPHAEHFLKHLAPALRCRGH